MTAPDKIWTAPTDGKCHVGFDTKSMNYTIEYTRTSLAQAAVAAAYEAAAQVCDSGNAGAFWGKAIRALANPDQIAALAAKVDASQAPNPAVNGGRCQSDTITLPLEDVKALMEAARAFQLIRAVWTDPHNDDLMRKASMTLDALRERMK